MNLDIVCLCADWCGTCRDYQSEFNALIQSKADWRAHWVDIESHEAVLGDVDITTFPMVLILTTRGTMCFAGPIAPQRGTLMRLCEAAQQGSLSVTDEQANQWQSLLQYLGLQKDPVFTHLRSL